MRQLFEYLGQTGIFESFNIVYADEQKCLDAFAERRPLTDDLIKLVNFMYTYWKGHGEDHSGTPFIFDPGNKTVKFNSVYKQNDEVQEFISSMGYTGEQDSFAIGKQTLKWGAGSFSRSAKSTSIPTDVQETISTIVINKYFADTDFLTNADLDLTGTLGEQYMQYKDWVTSWVQQFNTLKGYLKGWDDMVAVRYGDNSDPVSMALGDVHNRICKIKGISAKDALDPTDIILYKKSAQQEVASRLICKDSPNLFVDAKNEITQLFNDKLYVGVSLKKGKAFEARKLNYDPIEGFENAHETKVQLDPMYDFFKNDRKMIEQFRNDQLQMDWNAYRKLKPTKVCQIIVDCDDESGIVLNIRTNHDGYRQALVCEPHLAKAKAQMGKCPTTKWHNAIGKVNKVYAGFINKNAKSVQYDVDDLCTKWSDIMGRFPNTTTPEDLKKLFELFEPYEQKASDSVLWSIYNQIHFLWGYYNSPDKELMRKIMLWSEKIDEECLPYLLIKPA